jgi:hypothetical protein
MQTTKNLKISLMDLGKYKIFNLGSRLHKIILKENKNFFLLIITIIEFRRYDFIERFLILFNLLNISFV